MIYQNRHIKYQWKRIMADIKITVEIGDNFQRILDRMVRELQSYPSTKETNEGLKIVAEILTKLVDKGAEIGKGYYEKVTGVKHER